MAYCTRRRKRENSGQIQANLARGDDADGEMQIRTKRSLTKQQVDEEVDPKETSRSRSEHCEDSTSLQQDNPEDGEATAPIKRGTPMSYKLGQLKRGKAPVTTVMKSMESTGVSILKRSPCECDAETLKYQQPFLTITTELLGDDKMKEVRTHDEEGESLNPDTDAILFRVVQEVLEYASTVVTAFKDRLSELQDRPAILAILLGLFYVIPPEQGGISHMRQDYDYLVMEDGKLVRKQKSLSPQRIGAQFFTEKGSDKNSLTRWKTDVLIQSKDPDSDMWRDRLLVEAKFKRHPDDIYEAVSAGCNQAMDGLKAGPIDRLYIQVWAEEIEYGILDTFGKIKVESGQITKASYQEYMHDVRRLKEQLREHFPDASYTLCPQTMVELQARFNARQEEFKRAYNVLLPDKEYLVGVYHISDEKLKLPTKTSITSIEACRLLLSLLRIILGNGVLDWKWSDAELAIKGRRCAILKEQDILLTRSLKDRITYFNLMTMGYRAFTLHDGGWKAEEFADEWVVQLDASGWMEEGTQVFHKDMCWDGLSGRQRLCIQEGGDGRLIHIFLPFGVIDQHQTKYKFEKKRKMTRITIWLIKQTSGIGIITAVKV